MPADEILMLGIFIGVPVLLIGIVIANVAVFKMQIELNGLPGVEKKVSPWLVIGNGSFRYRPVLKYETKFGNGPLLRLRNFADFLIWPGLVVGLGCGLIEKVRH